MVLLVANLADTGKGRGVQRLERRGEHKGFYLGSGLYVRLGSQCEGVGNRPIDFYLEDLEKYLMKKQSSVYTI